MYVIMKGGYSFQHCLISGIEPSQYLKMETNWMRDLLEIGLGTMHNERPQG